MPDLADFDPGNIDAAVTKKCSLSVMKADEMPKKPAAAKDSHDVLEQSAKDDNIIFSLADSQEKSNPDPESGIKHPDVQGALKVNNNNNKELCKYYKRGFCRYGDLCRFQHSDFTSSNTVDVPISAVTAAEKGEDESPKATEEDDQNSPSYVTEKAEDESPKATEEDDQNSPSYEPQAAPLEALCINTDDEDDDLEDEDDEDDVPTCYCCYHS